MVAAKPCCNQNGNTLFLEHPLISQQATIKLWETIQLPREIIHYISNQNVVSYLSAHSSYLGFIHAGLRDNVSQRTSGQILHHHPQLVTHQVTVANIEWWNNISIHNNDNNIHILASPVSQRGLTRWKWIKIFLCLILKVKLSHPLVYIVCVPLYVYLSPSFYYFAILYLSLIWVVT